MQRYGLILMLLAAVGCGRQSPLTVKDSEEAPAQANAGPVKITHFYAGAAEITENETVGFCYGVENARSVRLEPPVEQLKPGYNRCFHLTPTKTTEYKLTAEGFDGSTATASVTVKVKPLPRPAASAPNTIQGLFTLIFASAPEVSRGEAVTLCYGAPTAIRITMDPPLENLKPASRFCFQVRPETTTTYRFTATAPDNHIDTAELTVKVR